MMKILTVMFSLLFPSILLAVPTLRMETESGYSIAATLLDEINVKAISSISGECSGKYLKDSMGGRLMVVFNDDCSIDNMVIYFSPEAYQGLYQGEQVTVSFQANAFQQQMKTAWAKFISI